MTFFSPARLHSTLLVTAFLAVFPLPAMAAPSPDLPAVAEGHDALALSVERYYAVRPGPLWTSATGLNDAGEAALSLLATADLDGLDPVRYAVPDLEQDFRTSSERMAVDRAISAAFVRYASDTRRWSDALMPTIGDRWAVSTPPSPSALLLSLGEYPRAQVEAMTWLHPIYRDLRQAAGATSDPLERRILLANMDRARLLPTARDRYILVDTAAAQLYVYEKGKQVATMRVIVGAPQTKTPLIASTMYWATLNPYWHVPDHITREAIAPRVVKEGMSYFNGRGYEVVSEWSRDPELIDPASIDWKAVAAGRTEIKVRQKPGAGNGMGEIKFQFPNDLGIYLHDTPGKALFEETERDLSNGCVRLEDAQGLARLLFAPGEVPISSGIEEMVELPVPVPVYLTYFTRWPTPSGVEKRKDIYARDPK